MAQEHVLVEKEQMTAARTKQREEGKHTGIRMEKKKRRKQGKKTRKAQKKIVLKVLILKQSFPALLQKPSYCKE